MIHPSKVNGRKIKGKKRRKKHKRRRRRYSSSSSSDTDGVADRIRNAPDHDTKRVTCKRPELFAHNIERPYSFPPYGFTTGVINPHSV